MSYPDLPLKKWNDTLQSLQKYALIVGQIRRMLTPKQKHWWHLALRTSAVGLTTSPIPYNDITFDLELDFVSHELMIRTSVGDEDFISLDGQTAKEFGEELLEILEDFGIEIKLGDDILDGQIDLTYDDVAVEAYWEALSQIDMVYKEFKGGLRGETGPIVLWPHHFDLAMLWFSGRLVPGQDPENEEYADEQMNFGFTPGDDSIPEAYFYATAYPLPDDVVGSPLPEGAYWLTDGFTGAILPYKAFASADDPKALLLDFLRTTHSAGSSKMK